MKKRTTLILIGFIMMFLLPSSRVVADSTSDTKPQVVIEKYEVKEGDLTPGTECVLSLDLHNTNSRVKVQELVLYISSPNNNVYPVYGNSNQIYVGSIAAESKETIDIPVKVSQLAENLATVNITLEYRGHNSLNYINNVALYLPISGRGILKVNNLAITNGATQGTKTLLSVNCGNYGEEEIYNVTMHINGNIDGTQKEVAIGNIASNAVSFKDYYVTFQQIGTQELEISFSFEDKEGNSYQVESTKLTTSVTEPDKSIVQEDITSTVSQENDPLVLSTVYLVAGVAILVILLAVIVVRIRKKK